MKYHLSIAIIMVLLSELCYATPRSMQCEGDINMPGNDSVCNDLRVSMLSTDGCGDTSDAPESRTSHFTPPHYKSRIPLAISTNGLYDLLLLPNIGLSVGIGDRITVGADWMGTWLNDSRHHYYRIYGGDLDLSYRLGGADRPSNPVSGHHVGVYASLVYYDLQRGASHRGYLSDKYNYAAGFSYTYSLPITRHFDLAFSIGIGYMWGKYMRHRPIDDHDVWLSTHKRSWFGPTRAAVSLVWVLGGACNDRKGGERR